MLLYLYVISDPVIWLHSTSLLAIINTNLFIYLGN